MHKAKTIYTKLYNKHNAVAEMASRGRDVVTCFLMHIWYTEYKESHSAKHRSNPHEAWAAAEELAVSQRVEKGSYTTGKNPFAFISLFTEL